MGKLTEHPVPKPQLQGQWRGMNAPQNLLVQNLCTGETAEFLFAEPAPTSATDPRCLASSVEKRRMKEAKLVDANPWAYKLRP